MRGCSGQPIVVCNRIAVEKLLDFRCTFGIVV